MMLQLCEKVTGYGFGLDSEDGKMQDYRVTHMEVVEADEFAIRKDLPENALALSTCYPFGTQRGGTQRYVVHAVKQSS